MKTIIALSALATAASFGFAPEANAQQHTSNTAASCANDGVRCFGRSSTNLTVRSGFHLADTAYGNLPRGATLVSAHRIATAAGWCNLVKRDNRTGDLIGSMTLESQVVGGCNDTAVQTAHVGFILNPADVKRDDVRSRLNKATDERHEWSTASIDVTEFLDCSNVGPASVGGCYKPATVTIVPLPGRTLNPGG